MLNVCQGKGVGTFLTTMLFGYAVTSVSHLHSVKCFNTLMFAVCAVLHIIIVFDVCIFVITGLICKRDIGHNMPPCQNKVKYKKYDIRKLTLVLGTPICVWTVSARLIAVCCRVQSSEDVLWGLQHFTSVLNYCIYTPSRSFCLCCLFLPASSSTLAQVICCHFCVGFLHSCLF